MYEESLTKAGLSPDQAKMYEMLLKNGVMPASKVSLKAGLKRGLGYKVLEQLVSLGLVEKIDKKVVLFAPNHPSKINEMVKRIGDELLLTESSINTTIGSMISDYNLTVGKPNVRFFDGEKGVKFVLEDSLNSKEEILSYADITSINKYISEINEWYVGEREKKGIKKRGILLDTVEARKILSSYNKKTTESRLIKLSTLPFESIMQIYDGKVSYITLSENQKIAVIIDDPAIYEMHKVLFNFTWSKAEEI